MAISPHKRQRVFDRDDRRCRQCGASQRLTIDHIVPRSRGGSDRSDNLQTLCEPCNQAKADTVVVAILPQRLKDYRKPKPIRRLPADFWPAWDHRDEIG